jgi:putative redox protein
MDAKVTWKNGLAFDGTSDSGFTIPLDSFSPASGEGTGFRPLELIAVGLGGCTAMDVISILQKMKQEVSAFEVKVHADRAEEHPKVFTNIELEYIVTGKNIDRASVEKAVNLSETRYCSAQAMLRTTVPIQSRITINEG